MAALLDVQVTDALAANQDYIAAQKVVDQRQSDLQKAEDSLSQQEKSNRPR